MITPAPDQGAPGSLLGFEAVGHILYLAANTPPGCFVEFGVYQGGSAWYLAHLAREQGRECHLYDTFEGIPFKGTHDTHEVGDFADTSYEAVSAAIPYAKVHKGVFPGSLVAMPPIAFAHIDCDQYQSVKDAIDHLGPLMVKGGLMLFDDYHCLASATLAIQESGREFSTTHHNKALMCF